VVGEKSITVIFILRDSSTSWARPVFTSVVINCPLAEYLKKHSVSNNWTCDTFWHNFTDIALMSVILCVNNLHLNLN